MQQNHIDPLRLEFLKFKLEPRGCLARMRWINLFFVDLLMVVPGAKLKHELINLKKFLTDCSRTDYDRRSHQIPSRVFSVFQVSTLYR